ncbi:protein of unknown function [Nitrospira japonica]|uniref:Uncharacterized protein n=1 Tax=Nitrospira japonica TaxID=1325564 RepID=A0A1W1I9Z7_9BACT|nr:protein of unknown function [Nitrospira japonica]
MGCNTGRDRPQRTGQEPIGSPMLDAPPWPPTQVPLKRRGRDATLPLIFWSSKPGARQEGRLAAWDLMDMVKSDPSFANDSRQRADPEHKAVDEK